MATANSSMYRRRGLAMLEGILIFFAFSVRGGWLIPSSGESYYLSRAKHFWDPNWCPTDFFCNTPDAHAVFDCTFGVVTLFLTLPVVAVCGRVLAWALLAWAWQRMSSAVVHVPFASVLSAALFVTLGHACHLAGEWVVGGIEAKCFAYAFAFLAIAAIGRNRWNQAWMLLGLACAFHVLVGGWMALAVACTWLFGAPDWPRLRSMMPGLIGGVLLAILGLIPALALSWSADPAVITAANRISVFDRLPHHLWPLSFSNDRLVRHMPLLAAWYLLFLIVPSEESQRALRGIVNCSVVFSFFGWAIALGFENHPDIAASLLRYYWFRLSDAMLPVGVAILGVSSIVQLSRARLHLGIVWGATVLVGTALLVSNLWWANHDRPVPRGDASLAHPEDWREMCAWISANMPNDAVFITPCFAQTFHWYAGRSEVVNHKHCPQDAAGIVEWERRRRDLYLSSNEELPRWVDSVNEIGTTHVLKVGQFYGADYVVATDYPPLDLPTVGPEGLGYVLYKLPSAAAARELK